MEQEDSPQDYKPKSTLEPKGTRMIEDYLKGTGFSNRTLIDTPTDSLQTVNRKYVTLNGPSANRPTSSVIGQRYFDTTIHKPVYWDGVGFRDAAGNFV